MGTISRRQFLKASAMGAASTLILPKFLMGYNKLVEENLVETNYGKIRGFRSNGVSVFKGVPYAGKVSGERRFLTPAPLQPWTGIKDAFRLGHPSFQIPDATYGIDEPDPDEECLVLNIWTPATDNRKRPVMVYNHGGGYNNGSAGSVAQDGTNLASRYDVVVVATNHRLGLLGYLYLDQIASDEYKGSGNRGVQDIAIALKWVFDNISQFGGDPNNVMIFGESGGGMKTSCLYAMPEAAPYFNKASIESGPGVIIKTRDEAAQTTELILNDLNIDKNNWRKLLELPAQQLLDAQVKLLSDPRSDIGGGFMGVANSGVFGFGAVVDGVILPNHPFEPTAPDISGEKPLLVGWNEDEYVFFAQYSDDTSVYHLTENQLKEKIEQDFGSNASIVLNTYKETNPKATPTQIYMAIRSIVMMGLGSIRIAERKTQQGGAPAYLYNFGYKSELKIGDTEYEFGAMHALDIPFKFYNIGPAKDKWGNINSGMAGNRPERFQASDNMCKFWTSFAHYGVPSTNDLPDWKAYNLQTRPTMRIDTQCELIYNRYQKEIDMWQSINLNQF